MEVFVATFNQMSALFVIIVIGFICSKLRILPESASSVISKLENYLLMPAVIINTFMNKCTFENLKPRLIYLVVSSVITLCVMIVGIVACRWFSKDNYERMMYRYSLVISNFGYVGNAIALGVFGEDFLFDYLVYVIPYYIVTYSIGVAWLKPSGEGSKMSWRNFVNPTMMALVIGIILGLCSAEKVMPLIFKNVLDSAAACMSPMAMILTGCVVAQYSVKKMVTNVRVYILSVVRLIVIPAAVVVSLRMLHIDEVIVKLALCSMCMPMGLNTIIIPAAYDKNADLGASMALISSVLAVVTIPLMFMM